MFVTSSSRCKRSTFPRLAENLGLAVLLTLCTASAVLAAVCPDDDMDDFAACDESCDAPDPNTGVFCDDCNDGNGAINPDAVELCGDGIDNNCDGMIDPFVVGTENGVVPTNPDDYNCNDFVDNDGMGGADLADPQCDAAKCFLLDPPACTPGDPDGCCQTLSFFQCAPGGMGTVCAVPEQGQLLQETEGPSASDPTCSDNEDNDCDELLDVAEEDCQEEESCDGIDNDGSGREDGAETDPNNPHDCNDGVDNDLDSLTDELDPECVAGIDDTFKMDGLGDACMEGDGACLRTGTIICDGPDDLTCSATPGAAGNEGPPGDASCFDGIDNDCDNAQDFPGDTDACTEPERCDGIDNDGDGTADEDFMPDEFGPTGLGEACTAGMGACLGDGVYVCDPTDPARQTTLCNATASLATAEGPAGETCSDTIDNDCDGDTDGADPGCASADLLVQCSMPLVRARPGDDCVVWRNLNWEVNDPDAEVTAELLALDRHGDPWGSIPVELGDEALMASRIHGRDWKLKPKRTTPRHEIFTAAPVLRVVARTPLNTAVAYCSHIPYMDVTEPSDTVITDAQGNTLHVTAAITLMDPRTLEVKVDGVDLFAAIMAVDPTFDPMEDFAETGISGPFGPWVVDINGEMVTVSDLVVDSAPVDQLSSNSLVMNLENLGCGEHAIIVGGMKREGSFPDAPTPECLLDDLRDRAFATTFSVEITDPVAGSEGNASPTPVMGEVCHGREITQLLINGFPQDVGAQTEMVFDAGTEDERRTVILPINTMINETDLAKDIADGDGALGEVFGTFDAGTNRLVADATDDLGNRVLETLIFATGDTQGPGVTPLTSGLTPEQAAEVRARVERQVVAGVQAAADATLPPALLTTIEIPDSFVVGISPGGLQTFIDNLCGAAGAEFAAEATSNLLALPATVDSISVPCSCDPTVTTRITAVSIDPNEFACPLDFQMDKIRATVELPDVHITYSSYGRCTTRFLGACVARTTVNATFRADLTDISISFDITEGQITGMPGPDPDPVVIGGEASVQLTGGIDLSCIGADICEVALTILTLGFIDFSPELDISETVSFQEAIKAGEPDPFEVSAIKLDELEVEQKMQVATASLDDVQITPDGITVSLKGEFLTSMVDPSIEVTPGALLTPAPGPGTDVAAVSGGNDVYIAVADDAVNQLFASMTVAGKLKTGCEASGTTVGDLLPEDCETLVVDPNDPMDPNQAIVAAAATAFLQGTCHGVRDTDCETVEGPDFFLTPLEQGICHGAQGSDCQLAPTGLMGTVFPADCDSIEVPVDLPPELAGLEAITIAVLQGVCHGSAGADCETLTASTLELKAYKQGSCWGMQPELNPLCNPPNPDIFSHRITERGACHGIRGTDCAITPFPQFISCGIVRTAALAVDGLFVALEEETCEGFPALNVDAADELLFCAQTDVPPRILVQDDLATDPVETALRVNDLSVALLADRDGGGLNGELSAVPNCLAQGAPTSGDCALFGLCLDLNMVTAMQFVAETDPTVCAAGQPGFVTDVQELQVILRQAGVVCGASTVGNDAMAAEAGAQSTVIDLLMDQANDNAPPACANGFDLGGVVSFAGSPKLFAIETDGNLDFQEYLAIGATISP